MEKLIVLLFHLKRLGPTVMSLRAGFLQWTKPFTSYLPLGTLADFDRSKAELVAENALLRQQLIILKLQVKRPPITRTDRMLLVLLARLARTWQQALLIVQPDTLRRLASGALSLVLEAHVQGSCSQAQGRRGNDRLDQSDGQGQLALAC